MVAFFFFFSSRRRHTRLQGDWSSDVCSSDLGTRAAAGIPPERAPVGFLLLRAFLAPVAEDPAAIAHAELAKVLAISGAPLWSRAFHWIRGLPRYQRQHAAHIAAIRERLARLPPFAIAGAGLDRAGVSACVKSGRAAARGGLERLGAAQQG